jgi:hypothetical protein
MLLADGSTYLQWWLFFAAISAVYLTGCRIFIKDPYERYHTLLYVSLMLLVASLVGIAVTLLS